MNITDDKEPVAGVEETAAVATAEAAPAAPAQTKKKAKKKPAKKKADTITDNELLPALLEQLYSLRSNTKVWVNLRAQTKEGEALHKLLLKSPQYKWRLVGLSHYLEARHTGDDKVVAFILPYNPKRDYEQKMKAYNKALDRMTKKSKPPEKPEKPANVKPCYQWHISARKGDDTEGTCAKFDEAVQAILSRKHLFVV